MTIVEDAAGKVKAEGLHTGQKRAYHGTIRTTKEGERYMAIDVTIRQSHFGHKTMPLEVILGGDMRYGRFECWHLIEGEAGESEIIVYHPEHIGRGFSVSWRPEETKELKLCLPLPTSEGELRHFYAAVERMVQHWKGKLIVDGTAKRLDAFMKGLPDMLYFNEQAIRRAATEYLNGESYGAMEFYSALWPLSAGREEMERFAANPAAFGAWLHEKQAMDVYHAPVCFYDTDEGVCGVYACIDGHPSVFPVKPAVPFDLIDPKTGRSLKCSAWKVMLVLEPEKTSLGAIDYEVFVERIGPERMSRYDGGHFLLNPLTEQEVRTLLTQAL